MRNEKIKLEDFNAKFELEEIPFSVLSSVGLSPQMVKDFPPYVMDRLLSGKPSPLLTLRFPLPPYGHRNVSARLRLHRLPDDSVSVLVLPKVKTVNYKMLSYYNREKLQSGHTVVANISLPAKTEDGTLSVYPEKCFVQIDPETNTFIYAPTQPVARNIRTLMSELNLDSSVLERIIKGEVVTEKVNGNDVTFGVDLRSQTSLTCVKGNVDEWKREVFAPLHKYTFGTEGCWVNNEGHLSYVEEKDYTMSMILAQRHAGFPYRPALEEEKEEYQEEVEKDREQAEEENNSRQRTLW